MTKQRYSGARIFDGTTTHNDKALVVEDGLIVGVDAPQKSDTWLDGGILSPSFVDLQANGGGGIMVDGDADAGRLAAICATHILQGCVGILPTLITDTPEALGSVIDAGITAAQANVPGFLGLHLEGPHLDPAKNGAHDAALIRPMTDADLALLLEAARQLPALMVTLAPSAVTPIQIATLAQAGVIVSLGHSNCTYAEATEAIKAGVGCVTHLFNAMSQFSSREPGLVGAVLDSDIAAGIIADGFHVSPAAIRVALAARPNGLFLVSDSMALAGTELTEMTLGGRLIRRENGRLTLEDGTLAGADLRLDMAVEFMIRQARLTPARALAMATSTPAALIGQAGRYGHLLAGRRADFIHIDKNWQLNKIWWSGTPL